MTALPKELIEDTLIIRDDMNLKNDITYKNIIDFFNSDRIRNHINDVSESSSIHYFEPNKDDNTRFKYDKNLYYIQIPEKRSKTDVSFFFCIKLPQSEEIKIKIKTKNEERVTIVNKRMETLESIINHIEYRLHQKYEDLKKFKMPYEFDIKTDNREERIQSIFLGQIQYNSSLSNKIGDICNYLVMSGKKPANSSCLNNSVYLLLKIKKCGNKLYIKYLYTITTPDYGLHNEDFRDLTKECPLAELPDSVEIEQPTFETFSELTNSNVVEGDDPEGDDPENLFEFNDKHPDPEDPHHKSYRLHYYPPPSFGGGRKNKTKRTRKNKTKRSRTKRSRTKRSRTKRSRTKRSRTKRSRTKRNKTKRNRTKRMRR
jgi:hypothetical protein